MNEPADLEQPAFLAWAANGFGPELVKLCPADSSGKSPGKRPLLDGWQTLTVTPALLDEWSRAHANVGLRTRLLPAVDIDVDEPGIADSIERVIVALVGTTARRVRANSARRALLCQLGGDPFTKAILRFTTADGAFARVEFLADGQQLVVAGQHVSGVPLQWPGGIPRRNELATMSASDRDAIIAALRVRLVRLGCTVDGKPPEAGAGDPQRIVPRFPKSEGWTEVEPLVALALSRLDPDLTYDEWIKVGMALHAKEPEGGGHGFAAWDEWSARGSKYPGSAVLASKWRTFEAGAIHFGTLLKMANVPGRLPREDRGHSQIGPPEQTDPTPPGRAALEAEFIAVLAERGAPALAELAGGPSPAALLSDPHRAAYRALKALAARGEALTPAAVAVELHRTGANGLAEEGQAALELALEAYGGAHEVGAAARLVQSLAGLPVSTTEKRQDPPAIPVVCAEVIVETPVVWLIPGLLARGELTDLAGDPGVGKGSIVASWTKRILDEHPDRTVLIFQTEDRLGFVRARLRAEGADLSRVFLLDIREAAAAPIFPGDAPALEALVRERKAILVALDPALEFLDASLDSHKMQDVQRFCASIAGIAQRTDAGVLTVRHLNKASNTSAIYKAAGSIGFVARARMALFASKDKENGANVLAVTKGNIGRDSTALTFSIVDRDGSTVVAWGAASKVTADELANQDPKKRGRPPVALEAAQDFIRDTLATGPMKIGDLLDLARKEHHSRATIYRAVAGMNLDRVTMDLKTAWKLKP